MPTPMVAGNWKMNGLRSSVEELKKLVDALKSKDKPRCDILVCPPATLIGQCVDAARGSAVEIGGQDCHPQISGAHTGDISAEMLKDMGSAYVIVGHSERRSDHGETSNLVRAKAEAVHRSGQVAIICIGETEKQRLSGDTVSVVVDEQLAQSLPEGARPDNVIVAYEPVWAIGTGLTPGTGDIADIHQAIRDALKARFGAEQGDGFRILYGGSVKPANAADIMAVENVDGALVGGASLKAADFDGIIDAYR